MGLIKDFIEFRKTKKKEKFLASLGLTLEDEPYLKDAVRIVKGQTPINENKEVESTNKGENKTDKPNDKQTPEEFIAQFTGEIEEFYPYGRDSA